MNIAGEFTLGVFAITGVQIQVSQPYTGFEGMVGVTLQARFAYGSGGSTTVVYAQTSLDGGQTWIDIAAFGFETASGVSIRNLNAVVSHVTDISPSDGAMTTGTSLDGVLGDQLRVKVVSTGTYSGSTVVTLSAVVR